MNDSIDNALGRDLYDRVLTPMKELFVGKDIVIDVLGVCLAAGENVFLHGPPGTAKSALVRELTRRIDGRVFDYLLTRFTEPNELFGPFDIRRLREGELVTNTEGMLPEAAIVFLDELLSANSAILNSLLMVLNERLFRRGRQTWKLPTLMVVGASNHLPDDPALDALFDRFSLRVRCDNVPPEQLQHVLTAGWKLEQETVLNRSAITVEQIAILQQHVWQVNLDQIRPSYLELVHRLRHAGINISDRRAVKFQRLLAASALICGRSVAFPTDLWVLEHVWETEEQQQVLSSLVRDAIARSSPDQQPNPHPRSSGAEAPDAEGLARDLERLEHRLQNGKLPAVELAYLRDHLGLLQERCQWVTDAQQRTFLDERVSALWKKLE